MKRPVHFCVCGDHAWSQIGRGPHIALVSPRDAGLLRARCWSRNSGGYAHALIDGRHTTLHQEILGTNEETLTDHRNGWRSDNRRSNIRLATPQQNMMSRRWRSTAKSGFRGVQRNHGNWQAVIQIGRKRVCLGTYKTPEAASVAYEAARKRLFGEFA